MARIAMQCGINENLPRSWIGKRNNATSVRPAALATPVDPAPVFVTIQIAAAKTPPAARQRK